MRQHSQSVHAVAPLRVSFAGGGTDVAPYVLARGGSVVSACITRYAHAVVSPRSDRVVRIRLRDYGTSAERRMDDCGTGTTPTLADVVAEGFNLSHGVDAVLFADARPQSGLGASSAMIVALLAALDDLCGVARTPLALAAESAHVERVQLRLPGGIQDHFASAHGGLNHFDFPPRRAPRVTRIQLSAKAIRHLESSLLLCHVGIPIDRASIHRRARQRQLANSVDADEILDRVKTLAQAVAVALGSSRLGELGPLVQHGWECKRRLDKGISTNRVDALLDLAIANGASGGKLLGAGGGGYLLVCCRAGAQRSVMAALTQAGATPEHMRFDFNGPRLLPIAARWECERQEAYEGARAPGLGP